jgi:hypothetical protein
MPARVKPTTDIAEILNRKPLSAAANRVLEELKKNEGRLGPVCRMLSRSWTDGSAIDGPMEEKPTFVHNLLRACGVQRQSKTVKCYNRVRRYYRKGLV